MKKKGLTHLIANSNKYIIKDNITKHVKTGNLTLAVGDLGYGKYLKPQHLYITTDEEIKEGDEGKYVIGTYSNFVTFDRIKKVHNLGKTSILLERGVDVTPNTLQIIVATDNPELWNIKLSELKGGYPKGTTTFENMPTVAKIPLSFLKEYIEKQPKEVWLEYNEFPTLYSERLKTNSDGSVIISPVEERMYTRSDFERFIKEYIAQLPDDDEDEWYGSTKTCVGGIISDEDNGFIKWFDKNYSQ